jgi:hypothetical protein
MNQGEATGQKRVPSPGGGAVGRRGPCRLLCVAAFDDVALIDDRARDVREPEVAIAR